MMMTIRATTSAVTTPAMAAPLPPDEVVVSGCTRAGDDTGKEEMSGC